MSDKMPCSSACVADLLSFNDRATKSARKRDERYNRARLGPGVGEGATRERRVIWWIRHTATYISFIYVPTWTWRSVTRWKMN